MKKTMIHIMATTGITLVVLALVATCYSATVIFIRTIFQALVLNIAIYIGIYFLNRFEYHYPILETTLKLITVLALVLTSGWIFEWYVNMSVFVLVLMTIVIFGICIFLDTMSLRDEVKAINVLLEGEEEIITPQTGEK